MEFDKELYDELKENICDIYGVRYGKNKKEFKEFLKKFADKYHLDYNDEVFSNIISKNIIYPFMYLRTYFI